MRIVGKVCICMKRELRTIASEKYGDELLVRSLFHKTRILRPLPFVHSPD